MYIIFNASLFFILSDIKSLITAQTEKLKMFSSPFEAISRRVWDQILRDCLEFLHKSHHQLIEFTFVVLPLKFPLTHNLPTISVQPRVSFVF